MISERILTEKVAALQQEYHQAREAKKPSEECEKISLQHKAAMKELSDFLSKGAGPCPLCGDLPLGMKVRSGVYEIGPIASPLRSRGEYAEQAVENWNKGIYFYKDKREELTTEILFLEQDGKTDEIAAIKKQLQEL